MPRIPRIRSYMMSNGFLGPLDPSSRRNYRIMKQEVAHGDRSSDFDKLPEGEPVLSLAVSYKVHQVGMDIRLTNEQWYTLRKQLHTVSELFPGRNVIIWFDSLYASAVYNEDVYEDPGEWVSHGLIPYSFCVVLCLGLEDQCALEQRRGWIGLERASARKYRGMLYCDRRGHAHFEQGDEESTDEYWQIMAPDMVFAAKYKAFSVHDDRRAILQILRDEGVDVDTDRDSD